MIPETIIERLRKIDALAREGADGERAVAQMKLRELCARHGVDIEELAEPETRDYWFRYRGEDECRLLCQVVAHVCQNVRIRYWAKSGKAVFELTAAQSIDVAEAFAHYRKAWKRTHDDAFSAFIQANRIFGPSDPDAKRELTEDDKRVLRLARNMQPDAWRRQFKLTEG